MSKNTKLEQLSDLLKDVLTKQELDGVPFVVISGDSENKGIIWEGDGDHKQFVFRTGPDRFFMSESLELSKGKDISVNGVKVLDDKELGSTITKSNLRKIGRLTGLDVDGSVSINQYLFYDAITDRLSLGTNEPKSAVTINDQGVEIILGASRTGGAFIGTYNSADLEFGTDNKSRIKINAGGNITLGNHSTGPITVDVIGTVNVQSINSVGPVKINNKRHLSGNAAPTSGDYAEGEIVWNLQPRAGKYIGWVCTQSGTPGNWSGFGKIE